MAEPPETPAPPVLLAVPAPLVPVAAVDVEALLGAPGCPRPLCPRP